MGQRILLLFCLFLFNGCVFFRTSENLFGMAVAVQARDELVFTCAGKTLLILDAKDPSNPLLIGKVQFPGFIEDVCVNNNIAYVAAADGGLCLIDVSEPGKPKKVGHCHIESANKVRVSGDFAYVAGNKRFSIVDVKLPGKPFKLACVDTENQIIDLHIKDAWVFIHVYDAIWAMDCIDPKDPKCAYGFRPPGLEDSHITGTGLCKDFLYYSMRNFLSAIDVSSPSHPMEVGRFNQLGRYADFKVGPLYACEDRVFASVKEGMYDYKLYLFDAADPGKLKVSGKCGTYADLYKKTEAIHVNGNKAYIAASWGGVLILDVSDPSSPRILGSFKTSSFF